MKKNEDVWNEIEKFSKTLVKNSLEEFLKYQNDINFVGKALALVVLEIGMTINNHNAKIEWFKNFSACMTAVIEDLEKNES